MNRVEIEQAIARGESLETIATRLGTAEQVVYAVADDMDKLCRPLVLTEQRPLARPLCGTMAAYRAHQRAGEPYDAQCRQARAEQEANRRSRVDEVAVQRAIDGHRAGVPLSPAERRAVVQRLTAQGYSATQIADRLGIAARNVTRHRAILNRQAS